MRITRHKESNYKWTLKNIESGNPVAFESPCQQIKSTGDIFLIMGIANEDLPTGKDYWAKTPVVNLRTGKLVWVDELRKVRIVECSVSVTE